MAEEGHDGPTAPPDDAHRRQLDAALACEADAQRALLAGEAARASGLFAEASERYRKSWEAAPPRSFGRLIGMLKAAVIGGDAAGAAEYARSAVGDEGDSPPSWYAIAIAALVRGDDALAARAAAAMRGASDPFDRAARALGALAERDGAAYAEAVEAIARDFEQREDHLTGVAIADTAAMLERLAAERGIEARPPSPLLPPV